MMDIGLIYRKSYISVLYKQELHKMTPQILNTPSRVVVVFWEVHLRSQRNDRHANVLTCELSSVIACVCDLLRMTFTLVMTLLWIFCYLQNVVCRAESVVV